MGTQTPVGIHSYVGDCGGVPALFVNGEVFPAAAYMTYLEEYNNYAQFAGSGYRLFSVPVLCAGRWISSTELFKPFHAGIFDSKDHPDFSSLDSSVNRILAACPDAYIFPRVNLSMPSWWIEENPDATDGTGKRELLCSEKYRETAADMLRRIIAHVNGSGYAAHIVGYHIAGGNTEEWFYFDMNAGCCKNAEAPFNAYLEKDHPGCGLSGLPDMSGLNKEGSLHNDLKLSLFLEFANGSVADTVCYLSRVAKEATRRRVVVGAFLGYSLEVCSPLYGTHALNKVLECGDVDFICSPNSYLGIRGADVDWTEMYPADSVRLHGKLCMQECDVRTHLTGLLSETAPEYDPGQNLTAPVWRGLENREQSVAVIRKSFCRQLIKGNGFWWFDMWGGWYNDTVLLCEMRRFGEIYSDSLLKTDRSSVAETAVYVDESAYALMTDCEKRNAITGQRIDLGFMGAPYDIYDVSDFPAVYEKYKATVFMSDVDTSAMRLARTLCAEHGKPYLSVSESKTRFLAGELRGFLKKCGAHIYCETPDLVYINENHLAIHASDGGDKTVRFKGIFEYRELLTDAVNVGVADTLTIRMKKNETKLFSLARR